MKSSVQLSHLQPRTITCKQAGMSNACLTEEEIKRNQKFHNALLKMSAEMFASKYPELLLSPTCSESDPRTTSSDCASQGQQEGFTTAAVVVDAAAAAP